MNVKQICDLCPDIFTCDSVFDSQCKRVKWVAQVDAMIRDEVIRNPIGTSKRRI